MVKNTMVIWVSFSVYYISYINQCYNLLSGIVMSEILQSRPIICFVSMDYLVKDCFFWKKSRFRCSSIHYPILPFIFYEKIQFNRIFLPNRPSLADLGRGLVGGLVVISYTPYFWASPLENGLSDFDLESMIETQF